ncbi:MAG: RNA 2',3'-cyclic phosphodiesterase [Pseudomonadota bacterium]
MHRLFVALRPPRPVRERLLTLMQGVRGARWQDDGQLHLTLRFIGEVERHRAEDIAMALDGISAPAFEIRLDGIGFFDRKGRPSTLWVGVAASDPLKRLHDKIEAGLRRIGIELEHRAFLPHITIARLNASTGPIDGFLEHHAGLAGPPFAVDHFDLFESRLGRTGAQYDSIARYPLQTEG